MHFCVQYLSLQNVAGIQLILSITGEVYIGFETGFVFGEVNADRVTWLVEKDPEDGNYIVKSLYHLTKI